MTIDLPPDLERELSEAAERRGTTPELLALDLLREHLLPVRSAESDDAEPATLADLLAGYVGVLDSSEFARPSTGADRVPGSAKGRFQVPDVFDAPLDDFREDQ